MKTPLSDLAGQEVVVLASGIRYRGILREVTEDHVCLQAKTGWRQIPMDQVTAIRPAGPMERKVEGNVFRDWGEF